MKYKQWADNINDQRVFVLMFKFDLQKLISYLFTAQWNVSPMYVGYAL